MNIELAEENHLDDRMMRDVYCETLIELAHKDGNIVALDADLMSSMGMKPFLKAFPERTINCGVAEANMIGIACGLSATGKIPFAHSFGPFASRRCYDQIFLSGGYAKSNVRVVGSDPGITAAYNGGTHMPFEDMGIWRNVPDATVIEPTDCVMLEDIIRQTSKMFGMFYIRLLRKHPVTIYKTGSTFDIGRGIVLKKGADVTLIASGILVNEALKAAEILKEERVSAKVVNIFTIKPIDKDLVATCAKETGAIVTIENHSVINGLGSAVAEALVESMPVPMERIGSQDRFGQVGSVDFLLKEYGMTAADIVDKAKKAIRRKKN
jgi:transketolase